jgi:hypothetical protein
MLRVNVIVEVGDRFLVELRECYVHCVHKHESTCFYFSVNSPCDHCAKDPSTFIFGQK